MLSLLVFDVRLSNSISLVSYQPKLVEHLLFCLFPSFKERALLPVEVTERVASYSVLIFPNRPVGDWECKGKGNF